MIFFFPVSKFLRWLMRGKNFLSPPPPPSPSCLPSLSCQGPSLDWSLVKFLCHFLLLPSPRSLGAPALPQSGRGFWEDVTAPGSPRCCHLIPAHLSLALLSAPPRNQRCNNFVVRSQAAGSRGGESGAILAGQSCRCRGGFGWARGTGRDGSPE